MNNIMPRKPIPTPPNPNPIFIWNLLKDVWERGKRALKAFFSSNRDVKEQKPLNEKKSSADDIAQIHQMLADYRLEAKEASGEILKNIKEDCNNFFEKTVSQFERYSESFGMQHMAGTYKKRFSRTIEDLDEIFDNCLLKRISLDDSECISILKMMPGESKANRMSEFKQAVFSQAIDDVCKSVERSVEEFFDTVDDTFVGKINSLAASIEEKAAAFEKLTNEREKSDSEIESTRLQSLKNITLAEMAFELLEGGAA